MAVKLVVELVLWTVVHSVAYLVIATAAQLVVMMEKSTAACLVVRLVERMVDWMAASSVVELAAVASVAYLAI